jgi:hypothetical protein
MSALVSKQVDHNSSSEVILTAEVEEELMMTEIVWYLVSGICVWRVSNLTLSSSFGGRMLVMMEKGEGGL